MSLPRDARLSPVRACRALCPQVVFALNKGCDGRGAHRRFLRRCKTATSYAGAAPPPRSHRGKGSSDPSGGWPSCRATLIGSRSSVSMWSASLPRSSVAIWVDGAPPVDGQTSIGRWEVREEAGGAVRSIEREPLYLW